MRRSRIFTGLAAFALTTLGCGSGGTTGNGGNAVSSASAGTGASGRETDSNAGASTSSGGTANAESGGAPSDTPGDDGLGGAANAGAPTSTTGGAAAAEQTGMPTCDTPAVGLGSCFVGTECHEGTDAFHASVVTSVCIEGLGFFPSEESCTAFQMLGRCYDPAMEYWSTYYIEYQGPTAEEREAACDAAGGVWCVNPIGVDITLAEECKRGCDAARPDYTDTPECALNDTCFSDCVDLALTEDGCATCVTERISWEPGGCNDFECQCPPVTF